MVLVLLVDLGLAAAGAVLLAKGLASEDDSQAEPAPTEKKTEAPARAPAAAALAPAAAASAHAPAPAAPAIAAAPAAAGPAAAATTAPAARKDTAKQREDTSIRPPSSKAKTTKRGADSSRPREKAAAKPSDAPVTRPSGKPAEQESRLVTSVPAEPQDPYRATDTAREIDQLAGRSKSAFDRCATNFGPAHGTIQIAFQVKGDGRIGNAAAVENSTGNTDLASCLITVVSSWQVSAHQGAAINMVRPFTYP